MYSSGLFKMFLLILMINLDVFSFNLTGQLSNQIFVHSFLNVLKPLPKKPYDLY